MGVVRHYSEAEEIDYLALQLQRQGYTVLSILSLESARRGLPVVTRHERTVPNLQEGAATRGNRWRGGKFGGEESPFGIDISGLRGHLLLTPEGRLARMVDAARFAEEGKTATRPDAHRAGQPFDPLHIWCELVAGGVDFVVAGGWAGVLHGSNYATDDIELLIEPSSPNRERLARALGTLGDHEPGRESGTVDAPPDGQSIRIGSSARLVWRAAFESGAAYRDVRARAVVVHLGECRVAVASLDDLIDARRHSREPADRILLEDLLELRKLVDADNRPVGISQA